MSSAFKNFKKKIIDNCENRIPRGELWLGKELLKDIDLADTIENHVIYAEKFGHDIICLPVSVFHDAKPDPGYSYFTASEVKEAAKVSHIPVLAVLDGPFQEMVSRSGLIEVLSQWIQEKDVISANYREISDRTLEIITELADSDISGIVVADDFSTDNGPMVSPSDIDALFSPFYKEAVKKAGKRDVALFLHCCGNLSILLPVIKKWQIDGLFAVQSTVNDLAGIYENYDRKIMILGGIEPDLLEKETKSEDSLKRLEKLCSVIGKSGDLIIGTSTGLYESQYQDRILEIYENADRDLNK